MRILTRRKLTSLFILGLTLVVVGLVQLTLERFPSRVLNTPKKVLSTTSIITPASLVGESVAGRPTSNLSPTIYNLPSKIQDQTSNLFPVTRIIDGDTIVARISDKEEKVRLIGIDTPEVVDTHTQIKCFGEESSRKARDILINQQVTLESDPTQGDLDRYGRLLRYVFLDTGENFNLLMIQEGYAREYTYHTPYKYQAQFKAAEVSARSNKKGMWGAGCSS